ncbi:MAG: P-type conjugative transfer protein TrbG [Bacteroidota bacterium]
MIRKAPLCLALTMGMALPALADPVIVPALEPLDSQEAQFPPAASALSNQPTRLTPKEKAALGLSKKWTARADMPVAGEDGTVRFLFGSTLPSVVCAPLYVCDIALQAGEIINDINVGDAVRWKIAPATSGSGADKITHVVVKPVDAGLSTNLVISTDRRSYFIKLVSTKSDWMPAVAFAYPDEVQREWAAYQRQEQRQQAANVLPSGHRLQELDFEFALSGDSPSWRPVRVYSDGTKTFIQFPTAMASADAPALVALGKDGGLFTEASEQLVNYRLAGNTYVVDKVLAKAALISGAGSAQERVTVTHKAGGR